MVTQNKYLIVLLQAVGLVCLVSIILSSISITKASEPSPIRFCYIRDNLSNITGENKGYWEVKLVLSVDRLDYYVHSSESKNVSMFAIVGPYDPDHGWNSTAYHIRISRNTGFSIDKDKPYRGFLTTEYINGVAIHPVLFKKKIADVTEFVKKYAVVVQFEGDGFIAQLSDSC